MHPTQRSSTATDAWTPELEVPEADRQEQEQVVTTAEPIEGDTEAAADAELVRLSALPLDTASEWDAAEQAVEVPLDDEDDRLA